jgi:putative ABC transport system permease protein
LIPLKYNYRNLRVRWVTTLLTVFATGLVVVAMIVTFGLTAGMEHALRISGQPLELIVLRKGANDESSSSITPQQAQEIATMPEVARDETGAPLCSSEYVTILNQPRRGNEGLVNMIMRGLDPIGRKMRPDFKIVEGRDVRPGLNEVVTSRELSARFANLSLGGTFDVGRVPFTVVGFFEAGGSSAESEVWTDIRDLQNARKENGAISSVCVRTRDEAAEKELIRKLREDKQFLLQPKTESEYFEDQMASARAMRYVGTFFAIVLTLGAMFAAANTMYAAVAGRSREIGTLRALGFRRRSILGSFLLESVLICLMGGALGCLAVLPFDGMRTGTMNWVTFSEFTFEFRFGPAVLLQGMLLAAAMGLLGGLLPAIRAVRLNVVKALREQ